MVWLLPHGGRKLFSSIDEKGAARLANMAAGKTGERYLFTSESVTEGHPDKVCDQISDAILDEIIKNDPEARVACEAVATTGLVMVVGEITTKPRGYSKVVRDTVREIGYDRAKYGFDADTCGVLVALDKQSPDISRGIQRDDDMENRCGRPGDDVRLRGRRDAGADAVADFAGSPAGAAAGRSAQK